MKRRSTLYHVDGERGLRGGERQLLYLAAALRARGRRNVIYARAGGELAAESARQGFETRHLPFLGECGLCDAAQDAPRCAQQQQAEPHRSNAANNQERKVRT